MADIFRAIRRLMQGWNLGLVAALLLASTIVAALPARAEGRWALVLGVADYTDDRIPDLKNTINDARTISASLNNMGFQVYYLENATKAELEQTVGQIDTEQNDAELGLFFFAGHGLQLEGVNYALPADISPDNENFLSDQGISVNKVIQDLSDIGTKSLVVILDSCRNSPFEGRQSFGTGLALTDAPDNTIIAYSTAPGAVALDGAGANSPYSAVLASVLDGPEQDIRDVLRLVRARVRLATQGIQTPWYVDNSKDEIIIQPRDQVELGSRVAPEILSQVSLQVTHWKTIANSSDPRDFQRFAELFPQTELTDVALRQLQLLGSQNQPSFPLMNLGVPDPNPEVPGGLGALITECDILATGVGSALGLVEPVPHDLVNTRAAMRACIDAVTNDPTNPRLLGLLARVLRLDNRFEEALVYMERAAELGDPSAYGGLAEIYRLGLGVEVDQARAAAAVRTGAMQGSAPMRMMMGKYYLQGWGVPQSFNEARRWMEIAAFSGLSSALTALGDMYRRGQGVEEDFARSVSYYEKAAALGSSDAMNNIGMAYMRGQGVAEDTRQGISWLSRASDEGNPYAAFHLGRAFLTGWGVERNLDQAVAYFRLSAQRNYLGAYTFLGDTLAANDADLDEAYANYIIAREAAALKDTIKSMKEHTEIVAKIDEITRRMTPEQKAGGEKIAADWIAQFGLLDFNLVHE